MTAHRRLVLELAILTTAAAFAGCDRSRDNAASAPKPGAGARAVGTAKADAAPKVEPKRSRLLLEPGRFALDLNEAGVQFAVRVPSDKVGGGLFDVTEKATWKVEPATVAVIDQGGYLRPLRAGAAKVAVTYQGETATAAVEIADPGLALDFAQDVAPLLTNAGCNTGGCHGRADGQNGFHLSLFGYDPEWDFAAITRQGGGRRLDRLAPAQSLFLQKAVGRQGHGGGQRIVPGSREYQTLIGWLNSGAPEKTGKTHGKVAEIALSPASIQLAEPGPIQFRVTAKFADGHERDVTRLTAFRTLDDTALSIEANGAAKLSRRSEVDLVARYQSKVVSARPATLINPDLKFDYKSVTRRNFIDDELLKRLEALKVPPSPPASDAGFYRRVSLDLVGRQPDPQAIREFLADTDAEKRVKLVDRLIADRDFMKFWRIKVGDLLQITSVRFPQGSGRYLVWVQESLVENKPWDKFVRELMTALGDPADRDGGPVNYALDGIDAKTSAEQTAQRFLALRIRCAQCHDHPFDIWTQDDYFGLAACFAKVGRGGPAPAGAMMNRLLIKVDPNGTVEHLRTKAPAQPRLLDGSPVAVKPEEDPRKVLADWMTSPQNPYFARATANWVWAQFFGKGIADPADDLGKSNPPIHPELLDKLAEHFVAHHFDLRELIRTIATSEAYGWSSATVPGNDRDTRFFSHQLPRPLNAYQMADALAEVTNVPNRFGNAVRRAIEVNDPATPSAILDTFGRCSRINGCAAVSNPTLSLRQALLLVGGDVVENKVSNLNGYLANLLDLTKSPPDIVENLYLRSLCRPPTEKELEYWSGELKAAKSMRDAAEDLFWALINSREFSFNH